MSEANGIAAPGEKLVSAAYIEKVKQRILEKRRISDSGCWEFTGLLSDSGYGLTCFNGRNRLVHRLSYEMFCGAFDQSLNVLHKCDNPRCFNPEHLWLGTQADNMRDCLEKGRMKMPNVQGEKNPKAKLTIAIVGEIRRRYKVGGITQTALAREHGVSIVLVGKIVNGRLWQFKEQQA